MRDYGKLPPTFWTRGPGRVFRGDHLAVAIAAYVHTCPASNLIGLYYLALPTLCHEVGASEAAVRASLERLAAANVAHFDPDADLVWVPDGAAEQTGATMKATDNRHKAVVRELAAFGNHRFVTEFWNRYGLAYSLGEAPYQAPSGAPTEGARPPPFAGSRVAPSKPEAETEAGSEAGSERASARPPPVVKVPLVIPDVYAFAFARGVTAATANPYGRPTSHGDMTRLVALIDAHAIGPDGKRLTDTPQIVAWVERTAEAWAKTADDFTRRTGMRVSAFEAWLNGRHVGTRGVQPPATTGPSWKPQNVAKLGGSDG